MALSFFSQKGYYKTSVQEIANQCGISKGTLYKYFQSKEDLLIRVCEYYQDQLFKKSALVECNHFASPKAWLQEHIRVQMEDFIEKKDFILMQFKEMPFHENERLKNLKVRMRSRMVNWQYERLMRAYGKKVEPFIWDTILTLQGTVKEYLFLIMNTRQYELIKPASSLIADRIDAFIEQMYINEEAPVVTETIMSKDITFEATSLEDTILSVLAEIKRKVDTLINFSQRDYYASTLSLIEEELGKEEPRVFLLEALLSYLEKEEQLIVLVKKARTLIQQEV